MTKRKEAFDELFNCYVKEGRELGPIEVKRLYPVQVAKLRKACGGSNMRALLFRMRKIYADRWHEIYADKNIVHVKPEKVSEPVQSPLEKLRTVTRKVNE